VRMNRCRVRSLSMLWDLLLHSSST
jgi:hypothetical protein